MDKVKKGARECFMGCERRGYVGLSLSKQRLKCTPIEMVAKTVIRTWRVHNMRERNTDDRKDDEPDL